MMTQCATNAQAIDQRLQIEAKQRNAGEDAGTRNNRHQYLHADSMRLETNTIIGR